VDSNQNFEASAGYNFALLIKEKKKTKQNTAQTKKNKDSDQSHYIGSSTNMSIKSSEGHDISPQHFSILGWFPQPLGEAKKEAATSKRTAFHLFCGLS